MVLLVSVGVAILLGLLCYFFRFTTVTRPSEAGDSPTSVVDSADVFDEYDYALEVPANQASDQLSTRWVRRSRPFPDVSRLADASNVVPVVHVAPAGDVFAVESLSGSAPRASDGSRSLTFYDSRSMLRIIAIPISSRWNYVAVSRDGSTVAVVERSEEPDEGLVTTWSIRTGEKLWAAPIQLRREGVVARSLSFCPSGRRLIAGYWQPNPSSTSHEWCVGIISASTGKVQHVIRTGYFDTDPGSERSLFSGMEPLIFDSEFLVVENKLSWEGTQVPVPESPLGDGPVTCLFSVWSLDGVRVFPDLASEPVRGSRFDRKGSERRQFLLPSHLDSNGKLYCSLERWGGGATNQQQGNSMWSEIDLRAASPVLRVLDWMPEPNDILVPERARTSPLGPPTLEGQSSKLSWTLPSRAPEWLQSRWFRNAEQGVAVVAWPSHLSGDVRSTSVRPRGIALGSAQFYNAGFALLRVCRQPKNPLTIPEESVAWRFSPDGSSGEWVDVTPKPEVSWTELWDVKSGQLLLTARRDDGRNVTWPCGVSEKGDVMITLTAKLSGDPGTIDLSTLEVDVWSRE